MDYRFILDYSNYKKNIKLPLDHDKCLYYIHFLLEQRDNAYGICWIDEETGNKDSNPSFKVFDKDSFSKKYGILNDGMSTPKYDSIKRLLYNYGFKCVCKNNF